MPMQAVVIAEGLFFTIEAIVSGSHDDVGAFLDELAGSSRRDHQNLVALLRMIANHGLPKNRQKYRKVEDVICEIKSFQVRLLHFRQGRRLLITNALRKKRDRLPPSEVDKAKRIRAAWKREFAEQEGRP